MSVASLLARAGLPPGPVQPLHGGDHGEVVRVGAAVVKRQPGAPAGQFHREAEGLQRLAGAGCRTPGVHLVDDDGLVLEYLPPGPPDPVALGRMIAVLHLDRAAPYGSAREVYLGPLALPAGEGDWPEVYRSLRMEPLLRKTWSALGPLGPRLRRWLDDAELPEEGPSLVHGDLWSGNVLHTASGPALIDPGVQRAERGLDLAMMELFGGFGGPCRRAYEEVWPVPEAVRRALPAYQLVYLLAHVHFFGRGYLSQVSAALDALDG